MGWAMVNAKTNAMFEIVRTELNKVDPVGVVIANKNLIDEYDSEIKKILAIIDSQADYKTFAEKICEIFIDSTELDLTPENFFDCAKNILERENKL